MCDILYPKQFAPVLENALKMPLSPGGTGQYKGLPG
jgi:hypothetical protein